MADTESQPRRRANMPLPLPREVALLLQGGGALGSFQAGVYQRLDELGIDVSWVAGISIGAVNAAIIAGNPPHKRLSRLKKFWLTVSGGMPNVVLPEIDHIREAAHLMAAGTVATFGVPGMFRPRLWPAPLMPEGTAGAISFYDSAPLKDTLDACIDWDLLNDGPVRLSVGAVDVESGNFAYWDTRGRGGNTRIDARHIMRRALCHRACRPSRSTGAGIGTAASCPTPRSPMCWTIRARICWCSRSTCSPPKGRCPGR